MSGNLLNFYTPSTKHDTIIKFAFLGLIGLSIIVYFLQKNDKEVKVKNKNFLGSIDDLFLKPLYAIPLQNYDYTDITKKFELDEDPILSKKKD